MLIVDDSALLRRQYAEWLGQEPDITVVGTAADPYLARDQIVTLKPDVMTLDIEMPRMDGLTFLGKLMHYYPMPVVIVSSLSSEGSLTVIKAMELGAVDAVCKPPSVEQVPAMIRSLADKIRIAAQAKVRLRNQPAPVAPAAAPVSLTGSESKILAIGASTGGTEAIAQVMKQLPENTPPTLIVQHMPEYFTQAFAARLNSLSPMEVREAKDGDVLKPGLALVAPGNYHLLLARNGSRYAALVREGPRVHHQRPSVEVLFNSVAKTAGPNAVGVILTGMGADGAGGLLAMREAGAHTVAQDEATSVVYGMPKAAADLGAAAAIKPLEQMPDEILRAFRQMKAVSR
ncbi:MAG: chemotaxis response regulator protein-glutamate methylesterase [Candidatus Firestonebacteria bacterium]|nr:chemotaxis response regulator protein-glutamate methylesterase [Candidatus Firestonebacteria bacterium]